MRSIRNFNATSDERVKSLSDKYDGLNEDELMAELLKSVSSAKADGSFSPEKLDEFVGFVSGSLDEQSLARLKQLVNMIKNN